MKFRTALAAATILALPLAANAQPISGLYIGGGAGINIMQKEHLAVAGLGTDLKSRIGPAFDLSIGYGLGNGLRVEMEGDYRANNFKSENGFGTNAGGREQKFGPMVNVVYDFAMVPFVQPYLGVGAGYQWAKEDNLHFSATGLRRSGDQRDKG